METVKPVVEFPRQRARESAVSISNAWTRTLCEKHCLLGRLTVTAMAVFGLLAFLGSEVSLADEIDCGKSLIQLSIEGAYPVRDGDCMKWIYNSPATGISYLRSIRTPDEFAVVISDHARARTYLKIQKLDELIKRFAFVKEDGTNFAEIERNKIGGKSYRTQRFDLSENVHCYGFLTYGSYRHGGYGAQAYGVFCKDFSNIVEIGLDDLTKFLDKLKVKDVL